MSVNLIIHVFYFTISFNISNETQAIYVQKHSFSYSYGLRFSLTIKSENMAICTKYFELWMDMNG